MSSSQPPSEGGQHDDEPPAEEGSGQIVDDTTAQLRIQEADLHPKNVSRAPRLDKSPNQSHDDQHRLEKTDSFPNRVTPSKLRINIVKQLVRNPTPKAQPAVGVNKIEASNPKASVQETLVLEDISKLVGQPRIDIIAVHDPDKLPTAAWTYIPERPSTKRPSISAKAAKTSPSVPSNIKQQEEHGVDKIRPQIDEDVQSASSSKEAVLMTGAITDGTKGDNMTMTAPAATPAELPTLLTNKAKEMAGSNEYTDIANDAPGDQEGGRQPPNPQQAEEPVSTSKDLKTDRKPNDDGLISHQSDRLSANKEANSPPEKQIRVKISDWLTDPTMVTGDVDRVRVQALAYRSPESTQSTTNSGEEPIYDEYLDKTAKALFTEMEAKRRDGFSEVPLVFLAAGFGCLVIPRLITLIAKSEHGDSILDMIAAIIFFDAPNTIIGEHSANVKEGAIPNPLSLWKSMTTNCYTVWKYFNAIIGKNDIPAIWFYTQNTPASLSRIGEVDFVGLDPSTTTKAIHQPPQRFRGSNDPNYHCFMGHLKRCLLFKASAKRTLEGLLMHFLTSGYDLGSVDSRGYCSLHQAAKYANHAAVTRLAKHQAQLVIKKDNDWLTPLHIAIKSATEVNPEPGDDRLPFIFTTESLNTGLTECREPEYPLDKFRKSPWEYALEDRYAWIQELKPAKTFTGASASPAEKIEDSVAPVKGSAQRAVCELFEIKLAQLYIENNTTEYMNRLGRSVSLVLYHEDFGIDMLLSRNFNPEETKRPTCQWIHLPANHEEWVHHLFARQLKCVDNSTSGYRHQGLTLYDRYVLPGAYKYNQAYELRFGEDLLKLGDQPSTLPTSKPVTALFMPIFGFEEYENRDRFNSAIRNSPNVRDESSLLINAYSKSDKYPLHLRRTLDQFTYYMLENTKARDNDQVMLKWAKNHKHPSSPERLNEDAPILMVDQLWLWVLEDGHTVISSVPDTWDRTAEYNFDRYLMNNYLTGKTSRPLIENSMDLANLIIRGGIDSLHRPGPGGHTLSGCFQSSITVIADEQTKQFNDFRLLVEELSKDEIDPESNTKKTNKLFQVNVETRLLAEIMDIQDELKTIQRVSLKQKEVLEQFAQFLSEDQQKGNSNNKSNITGPSNSSSRTPSFDSKNITSESESTEPLRGMTPLRSALHKSGEIPKAKQDVHFANEQSTPQVPNARAQARAQAKENLDIVNLNIQTIDGMIENAIKVQEEINRLLSHKQGQVNAWEARFAREAAEHAQHQSNIILVFTIVTVFFLPLSFMSSVFAIQIDSYPHDPESGEVNWPLGELLGLLVGVSAGMIALITLVGFNFNRIRRFLTSNWNRISSRIFPPKPGQHHRSNSDPNKLRVSTPTSVGPKLFLTRLSGEEDFHRNFINPFANLSWSRFRAFTGDKIQSMMARLVPAWGKERDGAANEEDEDYYYYTTEEDGDGESFHSVRRKSLRRMSTERSSHTGTDIWEVPTTRRRILPRGWFNFRESMSVETNWRNSSMDVVFDHNYYNGTDDGQENSNGRTWSHGKKTARLGALLRFFGRKKPKVEDVESRVASSARTSTQSSSS
ncbi:hypothetical protein F4859DRAFT_528642 [Xylaria cf. heliscus]|nr:hypothetical protein F4859DRAFT_528642 [Xylaria cf. heliscus]